MAEALKSIKPPVNWGMFGRPTEAQVAGYNRDLAEFYEKYKQFLKEEFTRKVIRSLSLPVEIIMRNDGNVPAVDIDIWLHFPDGFELLDADRYPKKARAPEPPYQPKSQFDHGPMLVPNFGGIFDPGSRHVPDLNFNKPDIRKTNSYEVDIHYKSLKHFQTHDLDRLIIVYPDYDQIISFAIDYKIIISNVPEPVEGKLFVKAALEVAEGEVN